jgi:hypothetical protein
MIPVNYPGVLLCTAFAVGLSYLWYGKLFKKSWVHATTPHDVGDSLPAHRPFQWVVAIQTIGAFLMIFTLEHNLIFGSAYLNMYGIESGFQAGIWNWLGFVAPVFAAAVLLERRTWTYWAIHAGYYLMVLLASSVTLSLWV